MASHFQLTIHNWKRVRSVLKLDTKRLKTGSGLTLAEMSRFRNGETSYSLSKAWQLCQSLQNQIWRLPDPPGMRNSRHFRYKKSEVNIQINLKPKRLTLDQISESNQQLCKYSKFQRFRSWIISLSHAKSLFKFVLGHKMYTCHRLSKHYNKLLKNPGRLGLGSSGPE